MKFFELEKKSKNRNSYNSDEYSGLNSEKNDDEYNIDYVNYQQREKLK